MNLMYKFTKTDLQSHICLLHGCLVGNLCLASLLLSHTVQLTADITALAQLSSCPPSSGQSSSTNFKSHCSSVVLPLCNPCPPHRHLSHVSQAPPKLSSSSTTPASRLQRVPSQLREDSGSPDLFYSIYSPHSSALYLFTVETVVLYAVGSLVQQ